MNQIKQVQRPTANISLPVLHAIMWVHNCYWGNRDGGDFSSKTNMCCVVVTLDNSDRPLGFTPQPLPTYFPLLTNQRHPQGESIAQQFHVIGWVKLYFKHSEGP